MLNPKTNVGKRNFYFGRVNFTIFKMAAITSIRISEILNLLECMACSISKWCPDCIECVLNKFWFKKSTLYYFGRVNFMIFKMAAITSSRISEILKLLECMACSISKWCPECTECVLNTFRILKISVNNCKTVGVSNMHTCMCHIWTRRKRTFIYVMLWNFLYFEINQCIACGISK